ncbi:RNA polymerase sigma factor [Marinoscillum sp. MHG1-6]|uniref:RNA polymerase sigma factor n=1 Tax=Marinoscillum sp. MHG1-6 TaxID=2959627 RepID=UPI002157FF4E|nr:RNA polymerase sigma-70 factor [Marinoscillum sp. MHG1-6]
MTSQFNRQPGEPVQISLQNIFATFTEQSFAALTLEEAIEKLKNDDQRGFDHVFHLYHKKIFYFCIQKGLDQGSAEEIVQEVFTKLWRVRSSLNAQGNIQSYIYSIAKNTILDEFRRRIKQKAAEEHQLHLLQPVNSTQNDVIFNELKDLIRTQLEQMPDKRRLVLEMSRFEGLTNKQIAHKMGISVKTVESHLTLALQTFREVLKRSEIISLAFIFSLLF